MHPVRFTDAPAMLLAGLRRTHAFAEAERTVPAQWAEFTELAAVAGLDAPVTYGAICGTDMAAQRFEYMTAIEVPTFDGLAEAIGRMRVPAARYAVFEHHGSIATLRTTWDAILHSWYPASGERDAGTPDFERYDARFDPATGTGTVEIWVPVVPRAEHALAAG